MYSKRKISIIILILSYINLFLVDIVHAGIFCSSVNIKGEDVSWCLPPYNRNIDGAVDRRSGCLKNLNFPVDFQFFMFDICMENVMVEDPGEKNDDGTIKNPIFSKRYTSYSFDPELIIRIQRVSYGLTYWESDARLKHGECKIIPNPVLGTPTTRICARKAGPIDADKNGNSKFDHGYTKGKYIDNNGNEQDDPIILLDEKDDNNKRIKLEIDYLKLCSYNDPGIIQGIELTILTLGVGAVFLDLMDLNPSYQPNHKGAEPPGVIMDIINVPMSIIKINEITVKLIDQIPLLGDLGIGGIVSKWLSSGRKELEKFLRNLFSTNRVVFDIVDEKKSTPTKLVTKESYGCINIPIGPYPPKYCAKLTTNPPSPEVNKICSMDQNGIVAKSSFVENINNNGTRQERCVLSNKYDNNFISNSLRVGVSKIIPICDDKIKEDCAMLKSSNTTQLASDIHKKNKDSVYVCSPKEKDQNCVDIIGNKANSLAEKLILKQKPFRPVYAVKYNKYGMDMLLNQSEFYNEVANNDNIVLYGINVGDYEDVNLTINETNIASKYLDQKVSINYKNQSYNLLVQLGSNEVALRSQGNFEICAYQMDSASKYQRFGCEKRAPIISPTATYTKKEQDISRDDKEKLYFEPEMRIVLQVEPLKEKYLVYYDVKEKVFKEIQDNTKDSIDIAINEYTTTMVDIDYKTQDSTTNNCKLYPINDKNKYARSYYCGDYFQDIDSVDKNGEFVKDNFYIGGFEKITGKYRRGGGWFCVEDNDGTDTCDSNPENFNRCVLAKTNNTSSSKTNTPKSSANVSTKLEDRILPNVNATADELKKGFNPAVLFRGCNLDENTPYCSGGDLSSNIEKDDKSTVDGEYNYNGNKNQSFKYKCTAYIKDKDNTKKCYLFDFKDSASLRNKTSSEKGLCVKINKDWSPKCKGGVYSNTNNESLTIEDGEYELGLIPNDKVKCPSNFENNILKIKNNPNVSELNFSNENTTLNVLMNYFPEAYKTPFYDGGDIQDFSITIRNCIISKLSNESNGSMKNSNAYCTLDYQNKTVVKFNNGCKTKDYTLEDVNLNIVTPCNNDYLSNHKKNTPKCKGGVYNNANNESITIEDGTIRILFSK